MCMAVAKYVCTRKMVEYCGNTLSHSLRWLSREIFFFFYWWPQKRHLSASPLLHSRRALKPLKSSSYIHRLSFESAFLRENENERKTRGKFSRFFAIENDTCWEYVRDIVRGFFNGFFTTHRTTHYTLSRVRLKLQKLLHSWCTHLHTFIPLTRQMLLLVAAQVAGKRTHIWIFTVQFSQNQHHIQFFVTNTFCGKKMNWVLLEIESTLQETKT
jgi:hypothetical protein